jgi:2-oxoglutarate ferredoxin oxidoreductase subunit beta
VFNDGAFDTITSRENRPDNLIPLEHGKRIVFGRQNEKCVVLDGQGRARIALVDQVSEAEILVHDEERADPGLAFTLSRLAEGPTQPTPIGVFRAVDRLDYGTGTEQQLLDAHRRQGPGDLARLFRSGTTWEIN